MVLPRASRRMVCIWELRRLFNALELDALVQAGGARMTTRRSAIAPELAGQPSGARSEIVEYQVGGRRIAICHRYLWPDGTLGGSGVPDPKWLLIEGEALSAHSSRVTCAECEGRVQP